MKSSFLEWRTFTAKSKLSKRTGELSAFKRLSIPLKKRERTFCAIACACGSATCTWWQLKRIWWESWSERPWTTESRICFMHGNSRRRRGSWSESTFQKERLRRDRLRLRDWRSTWMSTRNKKDCYWRMRREILWFRRDFSRTNKSN